MAQAATGPGVQGMGIMADKTAETLMNASRGPVIAAACFVIRIGGMALVAIADSIVGSHGQIDTIFHQMRIGQFRHGNETHFPAVKKTSGSGGDFPVLTNPFGVAVIRRRGGFSG